MQEPAIFDEGVEMKSLRHPFKRLFAVDMRCLLLLRSTFVIPEIVKAIPLKDRRMWQSREVRERVAIHAKFAAVPHTIPDGFGDTGKERRTMVSRGRNRSGIDAGGGVS